MFDRRKFFGALAKVPVLGAMAPAWAAPKAKGKDYFKELGVRPFINAAGTYTALTASLMPDEVMEAVRYASKHYVHLTKLQDAVGARIASLVGAEAAMVTSGAAGALAVGTAACVTGKDPQKILRVPNLEGMKNEVVIQKRHRYGYDHSVRAVGIRMVEIETAAELEKAIGERTAMLHFWCDGEPRGQISAADWAAAGKKHGVPTFADAADILPPVDNLTKYLKLGFDLVCFSGGKSLCGPQSAGLLFGKKELIEAARMNTSPNSDTFARGMKVNKEEMLGMLVALESYMKRDHAAEWKEWERRVEVIVKAAKKRRTVETDVVVPEIANHVPHLRIKWDEAALGLTVAQARAKLLDGEPSIEVCPMTNREFLVVNVSRLEPGEAEIVAKRISEVLKG
jgi:L-seryl-tRNA(Ser) seleniumtransferase